MAIESSNELVTLQKCPSGIEGLDEITCGGLPLGRPSLVCGSAGCGKTMLGMQFLVNGALQYNEPGVFVSFEETEAELTQNFASLGIDLDDLCSKKKLMMDYVYIDKDEIEETGDYDLEGLFLRLDYAINAIGAKRVVLDTIEALFSGLSNTKILRAELRRLFRWLKDKGVTSIITGEQGSGTLTRHGIEEYVSDCVILLDHKVIKQISTRRVRIVKYRGSAHETNEYPFLIDEQGISIMPITSIGLNSKALNSRVSTGIPRLDTMLGGEGFYVGSTVLISGTAGTGKTSVAAHVIDAACRRGERGLYFAFEESQSQIIRNMRSIGIDLNQWISEDRLRLYAWRPTNIGLEMHLLSMHKKIAEYVPAIVVIDPISNLTEIANESDVKVMLMRLMDFLKMKNITTILLDLSATSKLESTGVGISSLVDTWITLRDIELKGERNRGLHIIKSRGMAHSNQVHEFALTDEGIKLTNVYSGSEGTGSARYVQAPKEEASTIIQQQEIENKQRDVDRKRQKLEMAITVMKSEFELEIEKLEKQIYQKELALSLITQR